MRVLLLCLALTANAACVRGGLRPEAGEIAALPEGAGRSILERECLSCHELDALELFSGFYTRELWRALVITMRDNGAVVDDEDVEVLATYLARHFGTGTD